MATARYDRGETLFDLAAFEQGFWNATQGTLFFYSLEGDMSRFGRHFSPILLLILPFYALAPHPYTLLIAQTIALGTAAAPLYGLARTRLSSPPAALVIAGLYLASPATHDLNIVNDFHELSFLVPLLFVVFYAIERKHWALYAAAVLFALMVKEEVGLVVAALGVYVAVFKGTPRLGLATTVAGLFWFVFTLEVVMPWLRGPHGPVPINGYEYLGSGAPGIVLGAITNPGALIHTMTADGKPAYLNWLMAPVAFLPLLAPEVIIPALPGLLIILASTVPNTYEIFERYVAPVLPFVFVAAVVGLARLLAMLTLVPVPRWSRRAVLPLALLGMLFGTVYAQEALRKFPTRLFHPTQADPHRSVAMQFADRIPSHASVVVEDHRWLARLAHRRALYFLAAGSPDADYYLVDYERDPVTNAPREDRENTIGRISASGRYTALRCEDGVVLYARTDAYARDGQLFAPYMWDQERSDNFGNLVRLRGYSLGGGPPRPGGETLLTLYWEALAEPIGTDYTVFVHLLDGERRVGQHDERPQNGACPTDRWKGGQIVQDPHPVAVDPGAPSGGYSISLGLYSLGDRKRVPLIGPDGTPEGDAINFPLPAEE